jgi:hypothetical protein
MVALANFIGGMGLAILGSSLAFYAIRASLIPRDSPRRPWAAPRRTALTRIIIPFQAKNPRLFVTETVYGIVLALAGVGLVLGGLDPRSHVRQWLMVPLGIWVLMAMTLAGCYWLLRRRKRKNPFRQATGNA